MRGRICNLTAQPVRKRMSPVPNDSPITPLIRRSSKSTSPIIEFNSRRRKYYNHNFFPTTTVVRLYFTLSDDDQPPSSCRTTDHPTTTNLHQGCRATDADCGTRRPFLAIRTTARQQTQKLEAWYRARHHGARQHVELRGSDILLREIIFILLLFQFGCPAFQFYF